MRFYLLLLIGATLFTTACFKNGATLVTREDDKVRTDLLADLKQLELDNSIIENQVKIARTRIEELTISPKMYDIAKKDMYQKEKYLSQIQQQIAYIKIKLNDREKYFLENQRALTKEKFDKEFEEYSLNKESNPVDFPWRIPSMKKAPPLTDKEKSSHKE